MIITENPNQVEELIHSFDSNVANWHGKFVDSMTVSYGWVFSTERNWGSAYEISKAADARMYQSKERYYKESGADRIYACYKKATDWFIQPVAFFRDRQGYYHITFMVKIHRQQICQAINFSHFLTSLSLKLSGIYDNLVLIAIL